MNNYNVGVNGVTLSIRYQGIITNSEKIQQEVNHVFAIHLLIFNWSIGLLNLKLL